MNRKKFLFDEDGAFGVKSFERTSEQVTTTMVGLRRKADITFLRWQAHFDSPIADRIIPWFGAFLLSLSLALLSLSRFRDLSVGEQIGYYMQASHLMEIGESPEITQIGLNIFAIQAAWLFWPISLVARLFPTGEFLLTIQALSLGVAVVPIWRIARGPANLRTGGAVVLAVAYSLHPSIHNLNLAGFHPEAIAIPALLAAYLAGHYEKWLTSSGLLFLVLLSRADLGLAVVAIGVIFILENKKAAGRIISFVGLLWFLLMAFWVQPSIGTGSYPHLDAFRHFGEGSLDVIFGMLSDPFGLLKDLLVRSNFEQIILIIAPVLFLPLIHLRYVLPAVPLLIFYLIADVPVGLMGNPQQDIAVLSVVFIAATYALMKMGSTGVSRILVGRRILIILLLTATVFFIRDSASSPFEKPWEWGRRDDTDIARVTSVFWLGPDASVAAPANLYPEIAERKNSFVLKIDVPFVPNGEELKHLDAIIFDRNIASWTNAELVKFEEKMKELSFDRRYDSEGIQTWIRKPGSD
ncbi:MAG: DUF2079 domain-containing protein [Acidimicrobiales bacterium]|nr:DUF2079 domain-containing protein [Acidimicrobiales bacterium]